MRKSLICVLIIVSFISILPYTIRCKDEDHSSRFSLDEVRSNCLTAIDDLKHEMKAKTEKGLSRIKMAFNYCLELRNTFKDKPIELDNYLMTNLNKSGILQGITFKEICTSSLE